MPDVITDSAAIKPEQPAQEPPDELRQFVATVVSQLAGAEGLMRALPADLQPLASESVAFSQAFAFIVTAMACITFAGAEMTALRLQGKQPK